MTHPRRVGHDSRMADPKAQPKAAPKAKPEAARAAHWQRVLKVSDAEHEAARITGGIAVNVDVTQTEYESALNRWRTGAA